MPFLTGLKYFLRISANQTYLVVGCFRSTESNINPFDLKFWFKVGPLQIWSLEYLKKCHCYLFVEDKWKWAVNELLSPTTLPYSYSTGLKFIKMWKKNLNFVVWENSFVRCKSFKESIHFYVHRIV